MGIRRGDKVDYLAALCRSVPRCIVERVLSDPTHADGHRHSCEGTVLHADLVGYTGLSERLANSARDGLGRLAEILDALFVTLLDRAVFEYDGQIIHFGGDSLTAVFEGDRHAHRAAATAVRARLLLGDEANETLRGLGEGFMLRTGIASGRVTLLTLGDATQQSVVSGGDAAHRAVRLQQAAPPSAILVDEATRGQLKSIACFGGSLVEGTLLEGLREWPQGCAWRGHGEALADQEDEKVALLESFVPPPLAMRLRSTPLKWRLEGELRFLTICFAEISGIDLSERMAQDLGRSLLRTVRKHGGLITKVDLTATGYRLLILFGLYQPTENDGERAVLAALESVGRARTLLASGPSDFGVSFGIHAGRAYFGAVGSDRRCDLTVVGDAVNLAARAATMAPAFQVFVTPEVADSLRENFELAERDPVMVKGKSRPARFFSVHGLAPGSARYVQPRRGQRAFVGRDREIAELEEAVASAWNGQGAILGLCGDAGSGKSALLARVIDDWTSRGGIGLLARCRYATRSRPLAPIVSMLSSFLALAPGDDERTRLQRIQKRLRPLELERGAPELVSLLQPVERQDGETEALLDLADPSSRQMVLDSIVDVFWKTLEGRKLLYVLEDLNLADTLTLEIVERLARLPRDRSFLLVGTYRPDAVLEGCRRCFENEVSLNDLDFDQSAQLAAAELSVSEIEPELMRFLWRRSRGTPKHLVELIRFLRERSLVVVRSDSARAALPGMQTIEDVVPNRLTSLVLGRLDQLGAVERRVVRAASVIGTQFDLPLLATAASSRVPEDTLGGAIDSLEGRGIIVPAEQERRRFSFRDGLTRAVAYGTIPQQERCDIHRRIADVLEEARPERPGLSVLMAFHRERAQQFGEAVRWLERAASEVLRSGLEQEAVNLVERWEKAVDELPRGERPPADRVAHMTLVRLIAVGRRGEHAETLQLARRLRGDYWESLDTGSRAMVFFFLGQALLRLGEPNRAMEVLTDVYEGAEESWTRSDAARMLARASRYRRDREACLTWLERATEAARGDVRRLARIDLDRALLEITFGDLDAAQVLARDVADRAVADHYHAISCEALSVLGRTHLFKREFEPARALFGDAIEAAQLAGRIRIVAADHVGIGQSYVWEGLPDQARPHLDKGIAIATELGDQTIIAEGMAHLGVAVAWDESPERGASVCDDAYDRARQTRVVDTQAAASLQGLRVALLSGDSERIRAAVARCESHRSDMSTPLYQEAFRELVKRASDH